MASNNTIRNFYQQAIEREFSRDFLFRVTDFNLGKLKLSENDLVYVKAAKLPARTLSDIPVKYMGLEFHLPGSVSYGEAAGYALQFYCDAGSVLHQQFLKESARTFNDATSTGSYDIAGPQRYIVLSQLDKQLIPIRSYKLVGASIRNVGNIDYNIAEGTGAPVTFDITVAYHYFEVSDIAVPTRGQGPDAAPLFRT